MDRTYVYVVPGRDGWQVKARGMAWDHATRQAAMAFAEAMARRYREATRQPASVRVLPAEQFRPHVPAAAPRDTAART